MPRIRIALTDDQAQRLRELARLRRTSVAALVREAIDRSYGLETSRKEAWERALNAIGGFRSGRRNVSEEHDAEVADAVRSRPGD